MGESKVFEATDAPKKSGPFAGVRRGHGALKTHVGGQALIEGVMMRGKFNWAVAVREPSGAVYVEDHDLASGKNVDGWLHWPLVRGCRALVESLLLGFKALEIAALHAFAEEDDEGHDVAERPLRRLRAPLPTSRRSPGRRLRAGGRR